MNDPIQPLDVLVIGAGIAGLTAAIALGKQGHRVVVPPPNRSSSLARAQCQSLTLLRF